MADTFDDLIQGGKKAAAHRPGPVDPLLTELREFVHKVMKLLGQHGQLALHKRARMLRDKLDGAINAQKQAQRADLEGVK